MDVSNTQKLLPCANLTQNIYLICFMLRIPQNIFFQVFSDVIDIWFACVVCMYFCKDLSQSMHICIHYMQHQHGHSSDSLDAFVVRSFRELLNYQ